MKKVSIVTPVYNTEEYLNGCIDSVLNQTYKNIEFIIINDGSTDGSKEIIESYKDKRIVFINQKNKGIGKARNEGMKKVTGEYIMFLDSDDQMCSNAIEELVKKLEKEKCDLVTSNYYENYEGSNDRLEIVFPKISGNIYTNPKLINEITLGPNHKIFKTELFNGLEFPEGVKYEDFALMLKVMARSNKVCTLDKFLFIDTKRYQSETRVIDKRVYDVFVSLDDTLNFFKNFNYKDDESKEKIMNEVYYFITKMCTLYATKSKYQKDKDVKYKFIDDAYNYLKENVPNYKHNKYFKDCSFIKRTIQKHKFLLKIYCSL